jgi:uroporphyrinogen III methyltransferase/synthase
LENLAKKSSNTTWIIFTSVNAVDIFFEQNGPNGKNIRELKGINISRHGPRYRAEVAGPRIEGQSMPEEYGRRHFIPLKEWCLRDRGFVLPGSGARKILPETLGVGT